MRQYTNTLVVFLFWFLLAFLQSAVAQYSCNMLSARDFRIEMELQEPKVVLDCGYWDDFKVKRLPGAVLVEVKSDLETYAKMLDREVPVFVYSMKGFRSQSVCDILQEMGFERVYSLVGGTEAWELEAYSMDTKRKRRNIPPY